MKNIIKGIRQYYPVSDSFFGSTLQLYEENGAS